MTTEGGSLFLISSLLISFITINISDKSTLMRYCVYQSLKLPSDANTEFRGAFTPHNNIGSKEPPNFGQRTSKSPGRRQQQQQQQNFIRQYIDLSSKIIDPPHSQVHTADLDSTPSPNDTRINNLSQLGDSSSLFSYKTPSDLEFTGKSVPFPDTKSPIPFVFGASKKQRSRSPHKINKMVNERSPAKAPLHPVIPNEQPPKPTDNGFASKPPQPQFGQPTMPHSPLHRPAQKQSNVFLQPKSRPEHHRPSDRPCRHLTYISKTCQTNTLKCTLNLIWMER